MGSNASPEIADITFHEFEKKIISKHHNNIHFWKRFREDIFAIYLGTHTELTNFIHSINTMHPTFKFSFESSKQEITFLDVVVFKGARYHKQNILTKPTDTFQFLHRESCHPTATFNGFIKGKVLRYARTCNNADDFTKKVAFFTNKLLNREYKNNEITKITKEIDHNTRIVGNLFHTLYIRFISVC